MQHFKRFVISLYPKQDILIKGNEHFLEIFKPDYTRRC